MERNVTVNHNKANLTRRRNMGLSRVYMTIKRPDGTVEEKENEKFHGWSEWLHSKCKAAWANQKEKGELMQVREVETRWKKNPEWVAYNNVVNEGCGGLNPFEEFLFDREIERIWK